MAIPQSEWIWYSGRWVRWEEATVHVTAHALHYGSAVFEGIRAYETDQGSAIFRLQEHMTRMLKSAKIIRMEMDDYPLERLEEIAVELVARNGHGSCYIRPLAFRNAGGLGLDPLGCSVEVVMMSWEWGAYLGSEAIEQGVDVAVSSWRRFAPGTMAPLGKISGQYINNQFVTIEAKDNGVHEGIMLDANGYVAEGAGENLFMVVEGELWTPPAAASILAGITRDTVLTLAREIELPIRQEAISRDMLYLCDELFLTGTAAEITPVRSVDRSPVGDGVPGPVTRKLQRHFFDIVNGVAADRHGWLTIASPAAARRAVG